MIDYDLYRYSLVAAISLMLFFSATFVFGRHPDSAAYRHYTAARRRMGLALLLLSFNYAVHLFAAPRFSHPEWGILLNICTYFLSSWLFASSLMSLLVRDFNSPRRDLINVGCWALFSAVSALAIWISPQGLCDVIVLIAFSLVFMLYSLRLAVMLIRTYRRAVRLLDGYYSDNVAAYVRWVSVFTYLAVFYGVGQGVFTFIPDRYVFLWILSSIPFYCYGYIAYTNYALEVKMVDEAIEADAEEPALVEHDGGEGSDETEGQHMHTANDSVVARQIDRWIEEGNFTHQGLTIAQLAQQICTNRTYLSAYINRHYRMSFCDWINSLRLDHAKKLLTTTPDLTIADIAQRAGYMSLSNFTRRFTASEGIPPGRWRKEKGL